MSESAASNAPPSVHVPRATQPVLMEILLRLRIYLQQLYQERFDRLVLFGSYATGTAHPGSDVDILIVLHDPIDESEELHKTSPFVAQLCLDHNLLISRLFMSTSRYKAESSPLLRNIRAEGIVI